MEVKHFIISEKTKKDNMNICSKIKERESEETDLINLKVPKDPESEVEEVAKKDQEPIKPQQHKNQFKQKHEICSILFKIKIVFIPCNNGTSLIKF
jgi:hypothetical protein